MSEHSEIEWTDATWNPVRGCTKITSGCAPRGQTGCAPRGRVRSAGSALRGVRPSVRREKVLVFSGCNSHPATG